MDRKIDLTRQAYNMTRIVYSISTVSISLIDWLVGWFDKDIDDNYT